MITTESLSFQFRDTPIFDNFNWQVLQGESWVVLGPSGCGKSTLLALLAGLRFPSSGRIRINNEILHRPRPRTGLILQDYGLLPWATVRQNASLGLEIRSFYGADGVHAPKDLPNSDNVTYWLDRLGLLSFENKFPGQLSGGQRQRTAIARTLAIQPDLLLMDEPFSSLDAPTRESLQQLTLELVAEQGLTLVLVTHSIEEAALIGRKILLLQAPPTMHGQIIDNPGNNTPLWRESSGFNSLCKDLRSFMGNVEGKIK